MKEQDFKLIRKFKSKIQIPKEVMDVISPLVLGQSLLTLLKARRYGPEHKYIQDIKLLGPYLTKKGWGIYTARRNTVGTISLTLSKTYPNPDPGAALGGGVWYLSSYYINYTWQKDKLTVLFNMTQPQRDDGEDKHFTKGFVINETESN